MSGRVLQAGEQIAFVPLEGQVTCECPAVGDSRACICRSIGSAARTDAGDYHEPDADDDGDRHVRLDAAGDGLLRLRKAAAWLGSERVAELEAENVEQRKASGRNDFRTLFLETIEVWDPNVAAEVRKQSTEFARAVYDDMPYPPGFDEHGRATNANTTERTDARHQSKETTTMSHNTARAAADAAFRSAWAHPGDTTNLTPAQQHTRRADALAIAENGRRRNEHYREIRSSAIGAELGRLDAADEATNEGATVEVDQTPFEELQAVAAWAKREGIKLDDALRHLEAIRESRANAREGESEAAHKVREESRSDARDHCSRSQSAYQRAKDRMHNAWREPTDKLSKGVA